MLCRRFSYGAMRARSTIPSVHGRGAHLATCICSLSGTRHQSGATACSGWLDVSQWMTDNGVPEVLPRIERICFPPRARPTATRAMCAAMCAAPLTAYSPPRHHISTSILLLPAPAAPLALVARTRAFFILFLVTAGSLTQPTLRVSGVALD